MPAPRLAHAERVHLCDLLLEHGQAAPTLCEGWLTRDLAAHLFVRERRPAAMPGIVLGGRLGGLTTRSMASALRRFGYSGLVAKVRTGPPLAWRPFDEIANLVEYFVHTEDVRRASPDFVPRDDAQLDAALWAVLGRVSRLLTRKLKGAGLELERPDGLRIVARAGGPRAVLSGGAQEIVLFLYGRKQVARVSIAGDGRQAVLDARLGL